MNDTVAEATNTSGLHPVGRAVLIRPYRKEKLKSNLIEIPEQVQNRMDTVNQLAVVIETGPSAWHDEPNKRAYPGDTVLVTRYAGFIAYGDVTKDGETYRLVNDNDIFCRVEGE